MKVHHINLKELDRAISFLDGLPIEKNPVSMGIAELPKKHSCGTPACFGGYLFFLYDERTKAEDLEDFDMKNLLLADLDYGYGAKKFSEALGFSSRDHLECFLEDKPEIWGNKHGDKLFSSKEAFEIYPDYPITLKDIVRQLKTFKKNIEEAVKLAV